MEWARELNQLKENNMPKNIKKQSTGKIPPASTPKKPASGKVEYVPLVEAAVSGPVGIARFGAKSVAGQIAQAQGIAGSNESAKVLKKAVKVRKSGLYGKEAAKKVFF